MSTFKKHVGRIRNTDRRCVVVYMQIPGNEDNALIVDTDALPDRFHDALMDIIDSNEGQQTPHLHTLLQRRILPDLGLDMMNALHTYGQLRAVDIDNIVMYPAPNAPCPLRTIVDFMNGEDAPPEVNQELENRVLENQRTDSAQAQHDIANNILRQARDLEEEAARKKEQAYRLVPNLRPNADGSAFVPQVTDSQEVTEASVPASSPAVDETYLDEARASGEGMTYQGATPEEPSIHIADEVDVSGLPDDVKLALHAAAAEMSRQVEPVTTLNETAPYDFVPQADGLDEAPLPLAADDVEGNQVDTSDAAIQEFLDRAALRADMADREAWEAKQPKNPVGRPRKDGAPAGTKMGELAPTAPAPKKRGRPPKAKK